MLTMPSYKVSKFGYYQGETFDVELITQPFRRLCISFQTINLKDVREKCALV